LRRTPHTTWTNIGDYAAASKISIILLRTPETREENEEAARLS
jgi:hypothetical protein